MGGDIMKHIPDTEVWDLYSENREFLGRDHIRGEQLPVDGFHLVVHVWIRNSKGEYLISQRSANRPRYPLMWECVGGSVLKGENSLQGAIREVKEEVGIDLEPDKGQVLLTKVRKVMEGKIFNDIVDVWLFDYDGEVNLSDATTDEVAQVVWMNREQIRDLHEQKLLVGTLEYFFTEVN
jgi:8-oxo-dGTP pyrophosphatase MutT (NUDIX family)